MKRKTILRNRRQLMMRRTVITKIQTRIDRRGETIGEVLCAILVAAMSITILAGMLGAASRESEAAKKMDAALYGALSQAEAMGGGETESSGDDSSESQPFETGTVAVEVDGKSVSFNVKYYGKSGMLVSYSAEAGSGASESSGGPGGE